MRKRPFGFPMRAGGGCGEQGHAALMAAILMPVVVLGTLIVFNTGQLTATKLKVQNAADAAAYSAMQIQARDMNLIAYTNRAMVANQVAIGQMVSLTSWSRFLKTAGQNIQKVTAAVAAIPIIGQTVGPVFAALGKILGTTGNLINAGVEGLSKGVMPLLDSADIAYSGAQQLFHMGHYNAMHAVADQVVQLNDPAAIAVGKKIALAEPRDWLTTWGDGKGPAQERMAHIINASRDGFTADRSYAVGPPFSSPAWISRWFKWQTRKSGGTQLAQDPRTGRYIWSGMDTISTAAYRRKWGLFGGWKQIFNLPWGWGAAQSGQSRFDFYRTAMKTWTDVNADPQAPGDHKTRLVRTMPVYGNSWRENYPASWRAASDSRNQQELDPAGVGNSKKTGARLGGDKGITRYMDLKQRDKDNTDNGPSFLIVVRHDRRLVRDSVTALGISQSSPRAEMDLYLPQTAQHDAIRAAAKAQVYFRRPDRLWPRPDGLDERGNAFSPFWEARLVDLTAADRALVNALPNNTP